MFLFLFLSLLSSLYSYCHVNFCSQFLSLSFYFQPSPDVPNITTPNLVSLSTFLSFFPASFSSLVSFVLSTHRVMINFIPIPFLCFIYSLLGLFFLASVYCSFPYLFSILLSFILALLFLSLFLLSPSLYLSSFVPLFSLSSNNFPNHLFVLYSRCSFSILFCLFFLFVLFPVMLNYLPIPFSFI